MPWSRRSRASSPRSRCPCCRARRTPPRIADSWAAAAQGLADSAALDFHERQQWRASGKELVKPDYRQCIDIATKASLREMIAPGVLVIASPILVGTFGGVEAVSGLLAGAIVSSVQVRPRIKKM
jgi:Na+/H+-translocating membrane pyrophosphatase